MKCSMTYIGMATVVIEIGGVRIMTDPVLDPAGSKYVIGKTGLVTYTNQIGPALRPEDIGPIDVVALSHDHHKDNLDRTGRDFLKSVGRVLTTRSGSKRLQSRHGIKAEGLHPWQQVTVIGKEGFQVKITAMPARHGPPIIAGLVAGEVIGFILEWEGQKTGALYITGDTRLYSGVRKIARRHKIGAVLISLGCGGFSVTGKIRYSMNGVEGAKFAQLFNPTQIIPIHYDGWTHLREDRRHVETAFDAAGLSSRVIWLDRGVTTQVAL